MVTKKAPKKTKQIVVKARHAKPYRKRHLSSLIISLAASDIIGLQAGTIIGRGQSTPAPEPDTSFHLTASSAHDYFDLATVIHFRPIPTNL